MTLVVPEERMDEGDGKGDGMRFVLLFGFPLFDEAVCEDGGIDDGANGGGGGNGF